MVYLVIGLSVDTASGAPAALMAGLATVFILEFAVRCWDAPSRKIYVRKHWIDLVSSIPLVGGMRSIRLLRLLRLGAITRLLAIQQHEAERHQVSRDGFWIVGPILFVVWIGAASAYWTIENGVNPRLHDFGDALYWAFITATTVGYGDITPVTPAGRILAGILIFVGIGLVGIASARITQRLLHNSATAPLERRLEDMEKLIRETHELVVKLSGERTS